MFLICKFIFIISLLGLLCFNIYMFSSYIHVLLCKCNYFLINVLCSQSDSGHITVVFVDEFMYQGEGWRLPRLALARGPPVYLYISWSLISGSVPPWWGGGCCLRDVLTSEAAGAVVNWVALETLLTLWRRSSRGWSGLGCFVYAVVLETPLTSDPGLRLPTEADGGSLCYCPRWRFRLFSRPYLRPWGMLILAVTLKV